LDTLFLEFHGTTAGVAEQVQMFNEISSEFGASGFQWAEKEEDRRQLWRARHDAYYAGLAVKPGYRGYVTDVCVPISRLAECITQTQQDIAEVGLFAPIIGHVGDGNFHSTVFIDPDDDSQFEKALAFDKRLVQRALDMGGTCTGEHGIGMGKLKHMRNEHGDGAVDTMRAIKFALDPHNIMNPGKVIDC
ncbi:MAG: D-lactate dehydrogenase (cytochrome), partial [Gammaproteobacteria bacterium]